MISNKKEFLLKVFSGKYFFTTKSNKFFKKIKS